MAVPRVTIVDVGLSNTGSVRHAFEYLGARVDTTSSPDDVVAAEFVVLPGVGSFRRAMELLDAASLTEAIRAAATSRPVLGICLGMQLLAEHGTEDGDIAGIGLIPGTVRRLAADDDRTLKVPHVGFDVVHPLGTSRLLAGLDAQQDFYFVHSFALPPVDATVGTCRYGVDFAAIHEDGLVMATQFHPEKSQAAGLRLLANALAV
jgi:glutamine amidotransferase